MYLELFFKAAFPSYCNFENRIKVAILNSQNQIEHIYIIIGHF